MCLLPISPPAWQENEDGSCHLRDLASVSTTLEQQVPLSGQHTCQMHEAQLESRASSQGLLLQNGYMSAVLQKPNSWPAYLGADSPDVLDYGNYSLQQLEPGRNENSAGIAGACADLGQLTAALQSRQLQQDLALGGIVTNAIYFGVSLSRF